MSDIVNLFFKRFYPPDSNTNWQTEYCVGSCARKYTGQATSIFPAMVCADGFMMSVQAHFGAYSSPRDDFADHYSAVEILCPREPLFDAIGGHECGDEYIYGYVPVEVVAAAIEKHAGLVVAETHRTAPGDTGLVSGATSDPTPPVESN